MSPAAEVWERWNQLTDDDKEALYQAAYGLIGPNGRDLILALARAAAEDPVQRAHTATTHPYPYLPPPEPTRIEIPACKDCGQPINDEMLGWVAEENGGKRVDWLHKDCYRDRLLHRGPAVDGGRLQAFPAPIQEAP